LEYAVYFPALHPQGKNIQESSFQALGDMLAQVTWEMPQAQEYMNDLVQPAFLGEMVPKSSTACLAIAAKTPDPAGPSCEEQWKKVNKMVA